MRINTNVSALGAANNLTKVNSAIQSSSEKLSSGFRINRAADDAAGLGVANTFRADIRSMNQAIRNAEQANAVFSIAEGGAASIQKLLERMKELAAQSASDSVSDRSAITAEFGKLQTEITRVAKTTEFQGVSLLAGTYGVSVKTANSDIDPGSNGVTKVESNTSDTISFLIDDDGGTGWNIIASDATTGVSQTINVDVSALGVDKTFNFSAVGVKLSIGSAVDTGAELTAAFGGASAVVAKDLVFNAAAGGTFLIGAARGATGAYGVGDNTVAITGANLKADGASMLVDSGHIDVSSRSNSATAMAAIDDALDYVNGFLGDIGAGQNQLANAIDNLKTTVLNYQAAESTVRDLDMAAEMVTYSKNQILAQAGTAMLAQANQNGQGILKLLQ